MIYVYQPDDDASVQHTATRVLKGLTITTGSKKWRSVTGYKGSSYSVVNDDYDDQIKIISSQYDKSKLKTSAFTELKGLSLIHDSSYWHAKSLEALEESIMDDDGGPIGHMDWRTPTNMLDSELSKEADLISCAACVRLVREGANMDYRNGQGYTFAERAGMKGRYDVVAQMNEARTLP